MAKIAIENFIDFTKDPEPVDFNKDNLDYFWDFIFERHEIWYRRFILKQDPPWTKIALLKEYSFTNIYRRLDPGTDYVVKEILQKDGANTKDIIWNNLIYRMFGRQSTHEELGFLTVDGYNQQDFEKKLRAIAEIKPVFSIAYLVSGFHWVGQGKDKIELVCRVLQDWVDNFDDYYYEIKKVRSETDGSSPKRAQAYYNALKEIPGIGNFLAYQVLVDWSYKLECTKNNFGNMSPDSYNGFVSAGPGACRGICFLLDIEHTGKGNAVNLVINDAPNVLHALYKMQDKELSKRGFKWLYPGFTPTKRGDFASEDRENKALLNVSDLQNCLCEYHKIFKIETITGKARRKFIYPDNRNPDRYTRKI